jgi:UDP-3-O-[3-hydroxymyristoyl] glucosamine N-acyltransferase
MEFSAKQIAEFLQGKVEGDENIKVNKVCKIEQGEEGALSFLANPQYAHYIYDTKASIVIVNEDFSAEREINATLVRVKNAYSSFATLLGIYNQYRFNRIGISSLSFIDKSAIVGQDCYVGEFAVIDKQANIGENTKIYPQVYIGENVKIGKNCTIYAGVKIYHDVTIGDNCILHSGVVIGADGFGFAPQEDGTFKKIPQIGTVIIEEDVELGANVCVDRSTFGPTIIHKGVKIDNLCQIAHNVEVGSNTVMSAQTGLAGSTKVGENCFFGGQIGFAGHIKVGNRVKIGGQSGIMTDLQDDGQYLGSPAMPTRDFMRSYSCFKHLPDIEKRLSELENLLNKQQK